MSTANRAKVQQAAPEPMYPVASGTETVLLVEDEAEVRVFTKKLLEEFGYKVIEASDGEAAVNTFKIHKDEIQLLILDVIMPKKNGKEAYEEIKQIRPDIKAIFTSGYTADFIHQKGILAEDVELVLKPITPLVLLRKIREVLHRRKE
jgi:CheY-like chemotaxis protein